MHAPTLRLPQRSRSTDIQLGDHKLAPCVPLPSMPCQANVPLAYFGGRRSYRRFTGLNLGRTNSGVVSSNAFFELIIAATYGTSSANPGWNARYDTVELWTCPLPLALTQSNSLE